MVGRACEKGEWEGSCEATHSPLGGWSHQHKSDAAVTIRVVRWFILKNLIVVDFTIQSLPVASEASPRNPGRF